LETCKICNKNFTSLSAISKHIKQKHKIKYYNYLINICNISHPICPICNKNKVIFKKGKFTKYCSFECSVIGNSQNIEVNTRRSNTLKKFNKEHPEVREKVNEGLKKLYTNKEQRNKVGISVKKVWDSKTKEERKYWMRGLSTEETIKKRTKTLKELYKDNDELKDVISVKLKNIWKNNEEYKNKILNILVKNSSENMLLQRSNTLKNTWKTKTNEEKKYWMRGVSNKISNNHKEISDFIRSFNITVIDNYRELGFEIDIYLPDFKIGIEHNGLYWHSEISGKKGSFYHYHKLKICNENGIKLIQIFEDEWDNKKDILKSKLKNILNINNLEKVYARKCYIKEISNEIFFLFLEKNHVQGKTQADIKLGLYKNNSLMAVMSFVSGKLYKNKEKDSYELNRYATDINYKIIGGAGKLLSYFIKNYDVKNIYSFADKRYTLDKDNNLYTILGFSLSKIQPPSYFYLTNYRKRLYKYAFSKQQLKKKFPEIYDDSKTEWQMMQELGYDRIWDCGKFKYELIIEH